MAELLNNPTFTTLLIVVAVALVLGLQYFFGRRNWVLLGFVLPLLHVAAVITFYVKGVMGLSVRDILMPLIGLAVLAVTYERGRSATAERTQRELDSMKAQDHIG